MQANTVVEELTAPDPSATRNTGVIVTGGSSGLGRQTARLLAKAGRPVAVWGTNQERAEEVAGLCRAAGVKAIGVSVDVGDQADVLKAVAISREAIGRIGGLVCSAAIIRVGPFGHINFAEWELTLHTNLTGVAYTMEAVLPTLREVGRGANIVVVASTEALRGSPLVAAYAASKHGVLGLVRSASVSLAPEGIRVNAICAGAMDTPMMDSAIAAAGDTIKQQIIASIPLGYISNPKEVGRVIRFLLSPEASYVTGVALPVDGGMMA